MSDRRVPGGDLRSLLRPVLPRDASPQVLADALVPLALEGRSGARVVDLGCGKGDSAAAFRAVDPDVRWTGLDLDGSVEFAERDPEAEDFRVFDGARLPFADGEVDAVFCKQVLEHVERPEPLLADVTRVLAPGGWLVGSTSHLEPFHARSTANMTPYGLKVAVERAGLELALIAPGIDGPTLIVRRLVGGGRWFDRWWARRSPMNTVVDGAGRALGWDAEDRTTVKLLLCGQYAFAARRPATAS